MRICALCLEPWAWWLLVLVPELFCACVAEEHGLIRTALLARDGSAGLGRRACFGMPGTRDWPTARTFGSLVGGRFRACSSKRKPQRTWRRFDASAGSAANWRVYSHWRKAGDRAGQGMSLSRARSQAGAWRVLHCLPPLSVVQLAVQTLLSPRGPCSQSRSGLVSSSLIVS